jgi:D-aminopeptidase
LPDSALDPLFDAAAEATEQAIVNALFAADTVTGYAGHVRHAIRDRLPDWRGMLAAPTRSLTPPSAPTSSR